MLARLETNNVGNSSAMNHPTFPRSWEYDEDHHIRQYSAENDLLPLHENCDCNYQSGVEDDITEETETTQADYGCCDTTRVRRRRSSLGKAWETPSQFVMQRRKNFRALVHEETIRHRSIIVKETLDRRLATPSSIDESLVEDTDVRMLVGGKNPAEEQYKETVPTKQATPDSLEYPQHNVLDLLRDREVFGSWNGRGGIRSTLRRGRAGTCGGGRNSVTGRRLSGFCIARPISTIALNDCDDEGCFDDNETSGTKRRRRRRRQRQQAHPRANSTSPTTVTATDTATTIPPGHAKQGHFPFHHHRKPSLYPFNSHRPTTDELRTFAEQICVTKFESSYLSHLQDDDAEEEQQEQSGNDNGDNSNGSNVNNNSRSSVSNGNAESAAPSKAVSTISISFSPDGKTMASTHGDHTVKITCCLTGNLLQTLVGHPRTPWTVKFHPHAGKQSVSDTKTPYTIIADSSSNTGGASSSNAPGDATSGSSDSVGNREAQQKEQQSIRPQRQQILASGCLGHQVRIWDWISGTCLQMIRLDFAIISLSFHPSGSLLAIANGTRLHFWGLPTTTVNEGHRQNENANQNERIDPTSATTNSEIVNNQNQRSSNRGTETSMEMRHMLRCVHFLPDGKKVIVGGVNPQSRHDIQRQRRAAETGQRYTPVMSFYLRLWDFDLDVAKGLTATAVASTAQTNPAAAAISSMVNYPANNPQHESILASTRIEAAAAAAAAGLAARRKRPISNARPFVQRALLYNDGGFDVSPDGRTLCACAEYWLPEDVNNATDLLHPPDDDSDDSDSEESDYYSDSSDEENADGSNEIDAEMISEDADRKQYSPDNCSDKKQIAGAADCDNSATRIEDSNPNSTSDRLDSIDNQSATVHASPTRPPSLSSSKTPPRSVGRQQISSPPPTIGPTAGSAFISSLAANIPTTPIHQGGLTPQTPPPNVNPINFPLSPPSPPGRRFAGGLVRNNAGNTESSQQHIWQQQQQHVGRVVHEQQQQNQTAPSPQQQQQAVTINHGPSNSATIPAPPGINHHIRRQQLLHAASQQATNNGLQRSGNPFATGSRNSRGIPKQKGRFVPHVVTISLDAEPYAETTTAEAVIPASGDTTTTTAFQHHHTHNKPIAHGSASERSSTTTKTVTNTIYHVPGRGSFLPTRPHRRDLRPRLGELLSACPLDGAKASAVTCVKFSPCTEFCLIGYGVREPQVDNTSEGTPSQPPYHPVTAMYKVNKGGKMRHVSTMLSGDDDVNIARFHPDSGYGFVYGTKQGRIRVLGPRPWNYYNC